MTFRVFGALGILLTAVLAAAPAGAEERQTPGDILCEGETLQKTVSPLPEPASEWIVVGCTPSGQKLMPKLENDYLWFIHGTRQPFFIDALSPGAKVPEIEGYAPSQTIRFRQFIGVERSGEKREKAMTMLGRVMKPDEQPKIDSVYQLDAYSTHNGTIVNGFFYVADGRPQTIIFCRRECQLSVVLDVVRISDLTGKDGE